MDTTAKFTECFSNLDYPDNIPKNLNRICSAATSLIWEQLITKIRPKQEVEYIRNNILLNRLLKQDTTSEIPYLSAFSDNADYPLKEIAVWEQNITLNQHISTANYRIGDIETKLDNINKVNKVKYIHLENVMEKIHDHQQFIFLLNTKAKDLQVEIHNSTELLKQARNSTPIEATDQNDDNVVNTLKMCSEKLCNLIEQQKCFSPVSKANISLPLRISEQSVTTSFHKNMLDESLGLLDDTMSFSGVAASSFITPLNFSRCNLAILNDEVLNKVLADELHTKDRGVIWNTLNKFNERFKIELLNALADDDKICLSVSKKDNIEERKLYALHILNELKAKKYNYEIQFLKKDLIRLTENLRNNYDLKLCLEQIEIDTTTQQIQNIIKKMESSHNFNNEVQMKQEKVLVVQDLIETALSEIKLKMTTFREVLDMMIQIRSKISVLVRQLVPFTIDLNWTMDLDTCLNSMEIQAFLDFPVEYNRVTTNSGKKTYVRNTSLNCLSYREGLDTHLIHMLIAILGNPASTAEVLMVDMVKKKLKMDQFKSLQLHLDNHYNPKYTTDQLQKQDALLNYSLDKLKSFVNTYNSTKSGSAMSQIRNSINLWVEMPMNDFVSSAHFYEGKPYEYYKKLFNSYYCQL